VKTAECECELDVDIWHTWQVTQHRATRERAADPILRRKLGARYMGCIGGNVVRIGQDYRLQRDYEHMRELQPNNIS
jgi:hypothetical protein